mmetsp:Transcript_93461/g.235403  ORF Transcript_93461/g.235403 Transcript_93461/m.235403 type:complete len:522 (+) Transcript_93461:62-1627(+)
MEEQPRSLVGLYVVVGSQVSVLLGYDLGIIAAALDSIREYFHTTDAQLGWLVGVFALVQVIGTPVTGMAANRWGRRTMLGISATIATVGASMMAAASSFNMLFSGRMVTGIGVGAGLAQAPVYLAELAPSRDRGFVVSQIEVFLNVGIFLGFVVGLLTRPLGSPLDFRAMFALGALLALVLVVSLRFVPESPRWLLSRGRVEEAREALTLTVGREEVDKMFIELSHEVGTSGHPSSAGGFAPAIGPEQPAATLHSVWVALALAMSVSCCGIDAITYYSARIFEEAGIKNEFDRRLALVLLGFVKTGMIIVGAGNVDVVGRKFLLILSNASMAAAGFLFLIPGLSAKNPSFCIAGVLCYAGSFSVGVGPCFYLLATEIWPTHLRAIGSSFAHCCRGLGAALLQSFFLTVADRITYPAVMSICSASCLVSIPIVWYSFPETKGRSLEEIIRTRKSRRSLDGNESMRRMSFDQALQLLSAEEWGDRRRGPPMKPAEEESIHASHTGDSGLASRNISEKRGDGSW